MPIGSKIISWDGKDFGGKNMGAGMYIYQLETKILELVKKWFLLNKYYKFILLFKNFKYKTIQNKYFQFKGKV